MGKWDISLNACDEKAKEIWLYVKGIVLNRSERSGHRLVKGDQKMIVIGPSVSLLWITPDPELQIEAAGRTCYKSEDKITQGSARLFTEKMRKSGHHAMIEHAVASFRIITDRGITHEIVRHSCRMLKNLQDIAITA
jgi:thymidylate synthase ThyX